MFLSTQSRLTERLLDDVAVISLPTKLKNERYGGYDEELTHRRPFQFSSTYLWASMFSVKRHRQLMVVSIMASDATEAHYADVPLAFKTSYDERKRGNPSTLGTGTLRMTEGLYSLGVDNEPAVEYLYVDKARRLQIAWHAVKKEVDVKTAVAQLARIAASFRLVRDPVATFVEARVLPLKAAAERTEKLATAKRMLQREGYASLEPGKPVLRNGVYLEWMDTPEPRYQLLVPLGRLRAAANGSVVNRPRPAFYRGNAQAPAIAGSIGWREFSDGEWIFNNQDNDYLPFAGVGALLAAAQQDRSYVYFYYVGTVRVEESSNELVFNSLRWFLDGVPDVQRRWRDGTLVTPGYTGETMMARIITYLIFGGFAAMFLYVGATQFRQQRRNLSNAERIDATIVHSAVRSSTTKDTDGRVGFSNSTTTHTPDVRFRYVVSGEQYESEQLYPTIIGRGYASTSDAAKVLAPFPVNATVRAYVDRSHPKDAFLINEPNNGPIVFLGLGLLLPPLGWLVSKYII